MRWLGAIFFFLLTFQMGKAQDSTTINKSRFWLVTGGLTAGYTGSLVILNEAWYKGYERSSFHFFNDRKEWLGIDKGGHFFSSYYLTYFGTGLYRWTGLKDRQAAWAGFAAGNVLMTSIEILDGFSEKWGASATDLTFNLVGSGLALGQELAWQEQRIRVKLSYWPEPLPASVSERSDYLFGTSLPENVLKDYNGHIMWASGNIHSFLPADSKFPKWLNLAVGYGASGMLGGFGNCWCEDQSIRPEDCPPERLIERNDIQRYSQFYLSPDIDLTKIPTQKKWVKVLLEIGNVIKIPAPALEVNTKGEVRMVVR